MLDADRLTDNQMQRIAAAVGFNETGFICDSDKADIQIRFFTPGHEMNLCGHATVASLIALYERKGRDDIQTIEILGSFKKMSPLTPAFPEVLTQFDHA